MSFDSEKWLARVGPLRKVLEAISKKAQPRIDHWLTAWRGDPEQPDADFVADADYYMIYQEPLRARMLVRTLGIVVAVAIILASVIQLDEITRGEGKVIPSRQLQVLQSLDGGIVSEIAVREGEVVEAGQLLLQIDSTRFESSAREGQAQYSSLAAKAARLRALAEGKPFEPPAETLKNEPQLVEEERRLYEAKNSELDAQLSIARQQLSQRREDLTEMVAKRDQASRAYELSARELTVTKPLLASGAVSEVELLRLERDVGRFRGERDMAAAQIARVQSTIAEANKKIQEVELNFRNEARRELAETLGKLNALTETNVGLADKVKQSAIRSPVKGTVKRLLVNTVGGVVQPGKDLVEVVPLDDALLLEAKVLPRDIAFLHPGQKAMVRFTAYDFSIYGGLEGKLEQIGADSLTDEKGNTYYIVRVRTNRPSLGQDLPIIPGMVAQVDIVTGQKSILSYLLKPVLRAKQAALTER
ncbi:MAG: HlyD family type I secretion periplasmic adaptor subunit [Gammaproteobacteria bacterium]|nr:HlyD family type I secretion periplasmic adaptor subunit [Gammaproteobacteria bacterium]MBU1416773.1 HlyD family type I secretion periplasmic adaptor subunit [Gammaproteobacteria bacterium]